MKTSSFRRQTVQLCILAASVIVPAKLNLKSLQILPRLHRGNFGSTAATSYWRSVLRPDLHFQRRRVEISNHYWHAVCGYIANLLGHQAFPAK